MNRLARNAVVLLCIPVFQALRAQSPLTATVRVDATRVENRISPRMYAAFTEMMAEDVKRGLTAEVLLGRSFEQPVDYLGLPAHWQLEPDERNDNVGAIRFAQTAEAPYPTTDAATGNANHALHITLAPADITDTRRGFSQGTLSIRAGQLYRGYVWAKLGCDAHDQNRAGRNRLQGPQLRCARDALLHRHASAQQLCRS